MLTFPNAKINLGLNITEKRPDGYHNLETIFYPIPLEDALEVVPLNFSKGGAMTSPPSGENKRDCFLHLSGLPVEGDADSNLVLKAYRQLRSEFSLPPADIHLVKHIPMGAGLGGGSADAAFMLKLLNSLFRLGLTDDQLEERASRLGADCAFFVRNRPAFARGIGNLLTPLPLSLRGYRLWVVKPPVSVSTREAYARVTPRRPQVSLPEIAALPVEQWRGLMVNDFEESVFPHYPAIREVKEEMYRCGALYASMSGSGSSVYGLFPATTPIAPRHGFLLEL